MNMLKINIADLNKLFSKISEHNALFLPVKQAEQTNFAQWHEQAQVDLQTLHTVKSPKDIFFPQVEQLVSFKYQQGNLEITPAALMAENYVLFGVKACDLMSFELLDRIFLAEPVDNFYQARREHATVVSLACADPEETCFCTNFGVSAQAPNADVDTYIIGDTLYWQANTEKGKTLTASIASVMQDAQADANLVEIEQKRIAIELQQLPLAKINLPAFEGEALKQIFDSPVWEKIYTPCLGCGTCTYICPTCHCYDVKDFDTNYEVERYRCWDSCMYSDFTNMAHGNPRTSRLERFRQRYMHKLTYFPRNNEGAYACVGCGRCLGKCPVNMNIVKVARALEVK